MSTYVVAVDRAKARFFRLRGPEPTDPYRRKALEETVDLIHPAVGLADFEPFADARTAARSSRPPRGAHPQSSNDHREKSRAEADRRFARRVARRIRTLSADDPLGRWVVCAGAGTRGRLREALGQRRDRIVEVDLDIAGLPPRRILERLVNVGAVRP